MQVFTRILSQSRKDLPPSHILYQKATYDNSLSDQERSLISRFLNNWDSPLATWMSKGRKPASVLDQITKLRNRSVHKAGHGHDEGGFYRWQCDLFWGLVIGDKSQKGLIVEVFQA